LFGCNRRQGSCSSRVEAREVESVIDSHEVKHADLEGQLEAVKVRDAFCRSVNVLTVLLDTDASAQQAMEARSLSQR
jgi:hypothetical protein